MSAFGRTVARAARPIALKYPPGVYDRHATPENRECKEVVGEVCSHPRRAGPCIGCDSTPFFNNVLLILAQRPTATQVAGFRAWQKRGRQVREGEKAIRIYGCSTRTVTDTGDESSIGSREPRLVTVT